MSIAYLRYPTINNNTIVFVCEDDLWKVELNNLTAIRLTSNNYKVETPVISPDGKHIAFIGKFEGNNEIYVIPIEGGSAKRLTYQENFRGLVCAWTADSKSVIYSSPSNQPFYKLSVLHQVNINGGLPENLNLGYAKHISFGSKGRSVIGRNTIGLERWKRYRGGTAGKIWIDNKGKGDYKEWNEVNGNFSTPMWIGEKVYFISDHEGFGNLYAINANGKDITKLTKHKEFYCKQASSDSKNIVYVNGAEIYLFDVAKGVSKKLAIKINSSKLQAQTKFVDGSKFFQGYDIHPKGHSVALNARGKGFELPNWKGAVYPLNAAADSRQRLIKYFNNGDGLILVADDGKEEFFEIHDKTQNKKTKIAGIKCGRILEMKVSPNDKFIAATNHKGEIGILDLSKKTWTLVQKSKRLRIAGFAWSKDSNWITYATISKETCGEICVYNLKTKTNNQITEGDFIDFDPAFSNCGKYIYFISRRSFNPVYDTIYFDLNFPKSTKIFAIPLSKEATNPFIPKPKAPGDFDNYRKPRILEKEKTIASVKIDFEDITKRIVAMPLEEGNYTDLQTANGKIFYIAQPVRGAIDRNIYSNKAPTYKKLMVWNFEENRNDLVASAVSSYLISSKTNTIAYRSGNRLRVIAYEGFGKSARNNGSAANRKDGWIDLRRLVVKVEPQQEWKQMFNEIWRLQKQHFWNENMSGIDWNKVYDRYFPLLNKVTTRSELSDLAWEMQGELGTSHAYEIGGDYPANKNYNIGLLGCDFVFDAKSKSYKITKIASGDTWQSQYKSPLQAPGINAKVGDFIVSINNQKLSKTLSPNMVLVNYANKTVIVEIKYAASKKTKTVHVETVGDEMYLRYRDWVNSNRDYVHKKTNGKVGYVHLPNMGPWGYSEFHRYYANEAERDALIVDVRFNGGGHVSQLILEKLNRKQIGYKVMRWSDELSSYPAHSLNGPMLALTNEFAGSDGDIFSHNFKLMGLGKLVGKRTWGGVIGIWPRHFLIDGSVTTQPEFSSWYVDVGFGLENYGTDPDIEVEYKPQDFKKGNDPQLDKSIEEIKKELKKNPPYKPNFEKMPDLKLPK